MRMELRKLATVCKSFKDPALDLLWSCLDSLLPLIRVLPNLKMIENAYVSIYGISCECMD